MEAFINKPWLIVIWWLMCSVAVKQISYILMHGSIFESLRIRIRTGMENGWFGFRKINELFTCKVCMATQTSIWFVVVPLMLYGSFSGFNYFASDLVAFSSGFIAVVVTFSTSGLAVLFWNISEYKAVKFEAERENCLKNIRQLKKEILQADGQVTMTGIDMDFDRDQFDAILDLIEKECAGIGCGYQRKYCRESALEKYLLRHTSDLPAENRAKIKLLGHALAIVIPDYFRSIHSYQDIAEKNEQRDWAFQSLQKIIMRRKA